MLNKMSSKGQTIRMQSTCESSSSNNKKSKAWKVGSYKSGLDKMVDTNKKTKESTRESLCKRRKSGRELLHLRHRRDLNASAPEGGYKADSLLSSK